MDNDRLLETIKKSPHRGDQQDSSTKLKQQQQSPQRAALPSLLGQPALSDHEHHQHHLAHRFNSKDEFASGYLAACTSIVLLFPLNKIIFRQILDGISVRQAMAQLRSEGLQHAYRGMLPPLLQKSTSYSIMFGSQHEYYMHLMNSSLGRSTLSFNTRKHMFTGIAGGLAGLTEATLTPFERVQALLQMQQFHTKYKNTWSVFESVFTTYGLRELYRGYSIICLRNSLSNVLFFMCRGDMKSLMPVTTSRWRNAGYDFITGGLLGAFISTLFYPINVLKSHMQARVGGKYLSLRETFWMIFEIRERRWPQMYKGIGSNFTRALLAWGITNATYELILMAFKQRHEHANFTTSYDHDPEKLFDEDDDQGPPKSPSKAKS